MHTRFCTLLDVCLSQPNFATK